MLLLVGWVIVSVCLLGGFMFSGGNPGTLFVTGEYIIIIGMFLGYIVASSSGAVLKMMMKSILMAIKGSPYTDLRYEEPMSTGRRVAREIKNAITTDRLNEVLSD